MLEFKPLVALFITALLAVTTSAQLNPKRYPFPLRVASPRFSNPPIRFNHYAKLATKRTGPGLDVYIDLSMTSNHTIGTNTTVGSNTTDFDGFKSYLVPDPMGGTLHHYRPNTTISQDKLGYLLPLFGVVTNPPSPMHYKLQFTPRAPYHSNYTTPCHSNYTTPYLLPDYILYKNFTTVGISCGFGCGGAALGYNTGFLIPGSGDQYDYGTWYVIPYPDEEDKEQEGGDYRGNTKWEVRWIGRESENDQIVLPPGAQQVILWKS